MPAKPEAETVAERLVTAAMKLVAKKGPSAVKARDVAAACGLSSMVVYSHFGSISALVRAVADRGFVQLGEAFARVPTTDDPVTDLFAMALACRQFARKRPHLYDLMFGQPPASTKRRARSGRSPAFQAAWVHVTAACERLVNSGRAQRGTPEVIGAQLWSFVHGFVTLELAEHFIEFDDPVLEVMIPMGITLCLGFGDTEARAKASHDTVLQRPGVL